MLLPMLSCLALALPTAVPQQSKDKPSYRVVTYTELMAEVKSHKGKVIVVDLWTDG
jgi:hypothetical protein